MAICAVARLTQRLAMERKWEILLGIEPVCFPTSEKSELRPQCGCYPRPACGGFMLGMQATMPQRFVQDGRRSRLQELQRCQ